MLIKANYIQDTRMKKRKMKIINTLLYKKSYRSYSCSVRVSLTLGIFKIRQAPIIRNMIYLCFSWGFEFFLGVARIEIVGNHWLSGIERQLYLKPTGCIFYLRLW